MNSSTVILTKRVENVQRGMSNTNVELKNEKISGKHVFDVKSKTRVRTLYMTWHVPRHVFQAPAPCRNSIKYRAGDLCGNLICEYFFGIIGDPHFLFRRSLSFVILSIILKNKKNLCVGSFNYFLYTIQIGSNWYMDTGVRDLEVACF